MKSYCCYNTERTGGHDADAKKVRNTNISYATKLLCIKNKIPAYWISHSSPAIIDSCSTLLLTSLLPGSGGDHSCVLTVPQIFPYLSRHYTELLTTTPKMHSIYTCISLRSIRVLVHHKCGISKYMVREVRKTPKQLRA